MAWSEPSSTWLKTIAVATKNDESLMKNYEDCLKNVCRMGDYATKRLHLNKYGHE